MMFIFLTMELPFRATNIAQCTVNDASCGLCWETESPSPL